MHAFGTAPVVRLSVVNGPSSAPSQPASSAWRFTIVTWPLMTVVASCARAGGGAGEAKPTFAVVAVIVVVLSVPSGEPAGENTWANTRSVAPGAMPPMAVSVDSGWSPASNTPLPFVSQYSAELHDGWLSADASVTVLPAPLPSVTLPLLASVCV